jgi:hypothetical protein
VDVREDAEDHLTREHEVDGGEVKYQYMEADCDYHYVAVFVGQVWV